MHIILYGVLIYRTRFVETDSMLKRARAPCTGGLWVFVCTGDCFGENTLSSSSHHRRRRRRRQRSIERTTHTHSLSISCCKPPPHYLTTFAVVAAACRSLLAFIWIYYYNGMCVHDCGKHINMRCCCAGIPSTPSLRRQRVASIGCDATRSSRDARSTHTQTRACVCVCVSFFLF